MNLTCKLPDIVLADAADPIELTNLFSTTKLVLNCTGPFRFLGMDIVEACIKGNSNYMDITGEPQFMESSFLKFHDQAKAKGLLILHACAFDSVPADLGCLFASQQFPPQKCSSIESFLVLNSPDGLAGHYTTFECAVHGIGDGNSLKRIRNEINEKYKFPKSKYIGPKLERNTSYYYDERLQKYAIPFMGADASVVRSSQRSIQLIEGEQVFPQYSAYAVISDAYNLASTVIFGTMFTTLASFSLGRSLLLSFPGLATNGVFSHEGPTAKQLETASFSMHFFAKGYTSIDEIAVQSHSPNVSLDELDTKLSPKSNETINNPTNNINNELDIKTMNENEKNGKYFNISLPNKEVHIEVAGPEPGYVATPIIFITLALCFLEEREFLPIGGVFTPASAFYHSPSIIDRLDKAGITFSILETKLNDIIQFEKEDNLIEADVVGTNDSETEKLQQKK